MKSEILAYGLEILAILDDKGKISLAELEENSKIKGDELKELLKYLSKKEYINWKKPFFITSTADTAPINFIGDHEIKLSHKGMEVNLGQRDYFDYSSTVSKTINTTNITGSQNQVAQSGAKSQITQSQENIEYYVLEKMIEDDAELQPEQKSELKEIINKIKESASAGETGEKVYGYVKKGSGICSKYAHILWGLVKDLV